MPSGVSARSVVSSVKERAGPGGVQKLIVRRTRRRTSRSPRSVASADDAAVTTWVSAMSSCRQRRDVAEDQQRIDQRDDAAEERDAADDGQRQPAQEEEAREASTRVPSTRTTRMSITRLPKVWPYR